jgi:hypothetical protein
LRDGKITLIYRDHCPVSQLFLKGTIGWCERFVQEIVSGEVTETVVKKRDLLARKGINVLVASVLNVEIVFNEWEIVMHGETGIGLDPRAVEYRREAGGVVKP